MRKKMKILLATLILTPMTVPAAEPCYYLALAFTSCSSSSTCGAEELLSITTALYANNCIPEL